MSETPISTETRSEVAARAARKNNGYQQLMVFATRLKSDNE